MLLYESLKSDAAKATNDLSYCSYVLSRLVQIALDYQTILSDYRTI